MLFLTKKNIGMCTLTSVFTKYIVRLFVSCIVCSYFVSCIRLIKLTNETKESITRTKRKQTENEKQMSDTRKRNERKSKRYEISVNLNDPGSVGNDKKKRYAHIDTL